MARWQLLGEALTSAFRSLSRHPAYTFAAIGTLAVGFGAATTMFAVVHGVLIRPLPFAEPERLVTLANTIPAAAVGPFPFSTIEFDEYRRASNAFKDIAAYTPASFTVTGGGTAERVTGARVSANFFTLLGVTLERGHGFAEGDDRPGAPCTAVIAHRYWISRFGADQAVLDRELAVDDRACRIAGVAPAELRFPPTADLFLPAAIPQTPSTDALGRQSLRLVGRLRDDLTVTGAAAAISEAASAFHARHPSFYSGSPWKIEVTPLDAAVIGDASRPLLVLLGAVAVMFGLACVSVTQLMLGHVLSRDREFAVRRALGAGASHVAGLVLAEAGLVALAGAVLGWWIAKAGVALLLARQAGVIPRPESVRLDASVALFLTAACLVAVAIVALVPMWRARRVSSAVLRAATTATRRTTTLRESLVALQIALSLVLLVGAVLLARSLATLKAVDAGVAIDHRLVAQISPPPSRYPDAARVSALFTDITARVAALPGVIAAGGVSALPFSGQDNRAAFRVEGWTPAEAGRATNLHHRLVAGRYFEALGIPLISGRRFTDTDVREAPAVAIVNATFARRIFDDGVALQRRISFDRGARWYAIVGIVADVKHAGLAAEVPIEIYLPYAQATTFFSPTMSLVVHTGVPTGAVGEPLREVVAAVDRGLPVHGLRTMAQVLDASLARPMLQSGVTGGFAAFGAVLAAIGTFAVLTQFVAERRRDLAIRAALGASASALRRVALTPAIRVGVTGVMLGLAGAVAASRLIGALLFGVGALDPWSYLAAVVAVGVIVLAAAAAPMRRAVCIDAVATLKQQ